MLIFAIIIVGCSDKNSSGKDNSNGGKGEPNDEGSSSSSFNETGLPVVDDRITLTVASGHNNSSGTNWEDMEAIKTIVNDTNIELKFQLTPDSDWTEKRGVLLGTNQLPDLLVGPGGNYIVEYGEQGSFLALNDLIEEHAPNIQKMLEESPQIAKTITAPDGNIYALPGTSMTEWEATNGNTLWINRKWLDKLGLPMPTNLEEFKDTLIAFRDNDMNENGDPNDEIPFTFMHPSGNYGIEKPIFTSFDTENQHIIQRDGVAEYVPATENFRDAIIYLRELYEENLIDPEVFSYNTSQYRAMLSQEPPVAGAISITNPDHMVHSENQWDYELINPPLAGPNTEGNFAQNNPFIHRRIMITSANENPEATIRLLDYIYSEERSLDIAYGPNAWEYGDDGKTIKHISPPEGQSDSEWRYQDSPSHDFVFYVSEEMGDRMEFGELEHAEFFYKRPEYLETIEGKVVNRKYPALLNTEEEIEVLGKEGTALNEFTQQKLAEWITEGGIEEEWDDYLKQLENMGLEQVEAAYQSALDRFNES